MPCSASNPFEDRPLDREPDPLAVNEPRVFQMLWEYAFDSEGIVWPSQALIAEEVGLSRQTVNQIIGRLIDKGWVRLIDKRWGRRKHGGRRWLHNVYELLEPPIRPISQLRAKAITRRAHRRAREGLSAVSVRVAEKLARRRPQKCRCKHCRVDYASVRKPPLPIRPRSLIEEARAMTRKTMIERFGYVPSERYGI